MKRGGRPQQQPHVHADEAGNHKEGRKWAKRDGATMSATPVRISNPDAARVQSVTEVARLAFKKDPCINPILHESGMRVAASTNVAVTARPSPCLPINGRP
jgi:hypothetical protein